MRESGQAVVEWLVACAGVLALGGALAVTVPSVAPTIAGGLQSQICHVTGSSCDGPAAKPAPAARAQVAPPTATPPAATPPAPSLTPATPPAATPTPAQPPAANPTTPDRDLCGASYFNVPELWFGGACANHDSCYAAHRGKAACDTAFLNDMLETCKHVGSSSGGVNSNLTRASCRAAAHLYYKGVVVGGGFSYCHRPVCREE
jgi:hypothetical protein